MLHVLGPTLLGDTMEQPESLSSLMMNYHNRELHRKFYSITALLTLVTAINNRGHSTLSGYSGPYQTPLDKNLPTNERVLNAIAILLVQDAEAVAVTACDPSPHHDLVVWAVQQASQVNYASCDLDPAREGIQFDSNGRPFLTTQSLLLSQALTFYFAVSIGSKYHVIVDTGMSQLATIKSYKWDGLLSLL